MRVLFDQNVPIDLAPHLTGHEVTTARRMGWSELENGDLLKAAESGGFSVFVTCDRNLRYQQNLAGRSIAIVEITKNNWPSIKPHTATVLAAVDASVPGAYRTVECSYVHRLRHSSRGPSV